MGKNKEALIIYYWLFTIDYFWKNYVQLLIAGYIAQGFSNVTSRTLI